MNDTFPWPQLMNSVDWRLLVAGLLVCGALLGALLAILLGRPRRRRLEKQLAGAEAQLRSDAAVAEERLAALTQAEERLSGVFGRLANESLSQQSETFLRLARESLGQHQEKANAALSERQKAVEELVRPIREALQKTHEQIGAIEKARAESFGNIRAQLENMASSQDHLRQETQRLVKALRRPEVRGQWGELTLRRVVELAGMVEHCDFQEQAHVHTEDGAIRPDLIIHLPDQGQMVVDVKTPLDAFLEAVEAQNDAERQAALQRHVRNVSNRIRELAAKAYWAQFRRSPEFVVLFIPGEQFLSAALAENPALLEEAMRQRVILATPTSLMALLKAVAYGWRNLALADGAEEIRRLAVDLYDRLAVYSNHMVRLGKQLESSVKAYNQAVGSLERKVMPGARKFTELGVDPKQPIADLPAIETSAREATDLQAGGTTDDTTAGDGDERAKAH